MANNIHIAQGATTESFAADQPIMAGDTPPMSTRDLLINAAQPAMPQYTPLAYSGGAYVPWTVAGGAVVAMTAYAVPDLGTDQRAACYTAGMFNIDAVNWPAGTTEDQVQAATVNSQMQFRKLLYSDKRVTKSGLLVGPANHAPAAG